MTAYEFTNSWFEENSRAAWHAIFPALQPRRVLEVGCFEGRSTVYLIENPWVEELHCVDPWEGYGEHDWETVEAAERRFQRNIAAALRERQTNVIIHKEHSAIALPKLEPLYFDFIYIDGSHEEGAAVLDAQNAWPLLRVGGIIGFDDTANRGPSLAVQWLEGTHRDSLRALSLNQAQHYFEKLQG